MIKLHPRPRWRLPRAVPRERHAPASDALLGRESRPDGWDAGKPPTSKSSSTPPTCPFASACVGLVRSSSRVHHYSCMPPTDSATWRMVPTFARWLIRPSSVAGSRRTTGRTPGRGPRRGELGLASRHGAKLTEPLVDNRLSCGHPPGCRPKVVDRTPVHEAARWLD